ncbi:NfeD family protein, partial [Chloroflexota bacterium]
MEAAATSVLFDPNLLYFALILSAWIGVLALFMPGTGFIELAAVAGLFFGAGGLLYQGAGLPGLLLVVASFVIYAAVILRKFSRAGTKSKTDVALDPPLLWTLVGTVVQAVGGLVISLSLPGLLWWLVILLALISLAVYRWMLLPTVNALHPAPQSGVEAIIGAEAEIRTPPQGTSAGMAFLEGELWQVISDDKLAAGDTVDVIAREGMKLVVQKSVSRQ